MPSIKIDKSKVKRIDLINVQGGMTAKEVYAKYKPDVFMNLALYDTLYGTNITKLEDENVQSGYLFSDKGYGIKGDKEVVWTTFQQAVQSKDIRDFFAFSPLLMDNGVKNIDWGNKVSNQVNGTSYRSLFGDNENEYIFAVSNTPLSIDDEQKLAESLGCIRAGNFDGGGSCHLQQGTNIIVNSNRANVSWLLMWLEKPADKIGFDCNTKLSYETAKKFKDDGWDFAVRYIGRNSMASYDIDKVELDNILRAGLSLALVQHCPTSPGIIPFSELGKTWGANANKFAQEVGYEKGCVVYLDLENVNIAYKYKQDLIYAYCNSWFDALTDYEPGIYVGYNTFLTGKMLYSYLKFKRYWKGYNVYNDVANRGYSMRQYSHPSVFGIPIDKNILTTDNFGEYPKLMKAKEPETSALDKALEVLFKVGITNSPQYWKDRCKEVKYLDGLIINFANYVNKN
jgi:hypothetical protein